MSAIVVPHVAPPNVIDPVVPEPKRFGLFSVALMVPDPTLRWEAGVQWQPLACERAALLSSICDGEDAAGLPLTLRAGSAPVTALPFVAVGSYDCSTFSLPPAEAETRARQHLALGEERAAEYAFASGLFDNLPALDGGVDLTPVGGPVPVGYGIGLLESHLGINYGGGGVIHAPRLLGAAAARQAHISRYGQRLETTLGTPVAFGGGYDDFQADFPTEGVATMYASSRPVVRRSEVFVTPDDEFRPHQDVNDMQVAAQRVYLITVDCAVAKVEVAPYTESDGEGGE